MRSIWKVENKIRSFIFWSKYSNGKKVAELCLLSLCYKNICLHLKRSNCVVYTFKYANLLEERTVITSWLGDNSVQWASQYFPFDIVDAFLKTKKSIDENTRPDEPNDLSFDDGDINLEDLSLELRNENLSHACRKRLLGRNHRRCFIKKGVFRNSADFTGKQLCRSLIFNKVAG